KHSILLSILLCTFCHFFYCSLLFSYFLLFSFLSRLSNILHLFSSSSFYVLFPLSFCPTFPYFSRSFAISYPVIIPFYFSLSSISFYIFTCYTFRYFFLV